METRTLKVKIKDMITVNVIIMEISTAQGNIMETITVQAIIIGTTTILAIIMKATKVQAVILKTVTTQAILMKTSTVHAITIKATAVQTINRWTTTVQTMIMNPTTAQLIIIKTTITVQAFTMKTTMVELIIMKSTTEHSAISPPSRRKPDSLVSIDSPTNTNYPSGLDEERTSFSSPSHLKEKTHVFGRIMILQNENEGLHQSLLQTAVRMECLGEEFISSQKILETELQKTRMELSNLMDRFNRLSNDCSSTQQTNSLLEQKLHSVLQNMEAERERLNLRISELTEQLSEAQYASTMEEIRDATAELHKINLHTHSGDAFPQMIPPIAPPPAQFMDNLNYGKEATSAPEQPLGSVPEEEESDWSEVGEETPHLLLTGSNRGQAWRQQEADMDKDSESGSEDLVRRHSPRPLHIPHLQFTIHNEFMPSSRASTLPSCFKNLSDSMPSKDSYRITTSPNVKSAILIRSASLEEIPLTRHHEELRGTEAIMNLHHSADVAFEDLDNQIIHHWRTSNDRDTVIRTMIKSRVPEADGSLASLQSAEQLLNHFICDTPSGEGREPSRVEMHGWTGGIPEEVLKGEQTQL
ncbi:hypothetical protein AMECASPLE_005002 [Ameca splendens]|uniref:Uncharacterized protein n=1 Tax=Ameca splendens TaxID=208324 RepID=A0ABV1A581_9TELE